MKTNVKSFVTGLLVGTIGVATVFATSTIRSAEFNNTSVIFNGEELDLSGNQMISVTTNENSDAVSNYMPVRAVLEQMGYEVDFDGGRNAVIVNDGSTEVLDDTSIPETVSNLLSTFTGTTTAQKAAEQAERDADTIILSPEDNLPIVELNINGTTLSGIVFEGKEYYSSYDLLNAIDISWGFSDDKESLIFRQEPENPFDDWKVIYTLPFSHPAFVEYNFRDYIELEYFQQNILSLYQ